MTYKTNDVRINVVLWCDRLTILAARKQKYYIFWMCVCGLTYPECKAHAPYFTVIMASLSLPYFSTLSHKRYDCRKIFSISLYRLLRPLGWVKYSSTLFKTSALKMRVGGDQHHAPAALPRGGPGTHWTGGWVGLRAGLDGCGKSRPTPGFDPRTVQPAVSRYTDWAIPAAPENTYWV